MVPGWSRTNCAIVGMIGRSTCSIRREGDIGMIGGF
jgi:hypothetical protein